LLGFDKVVEEEQDDNGVFLLGLDFVFFDEGLESEAKCILESIFSDSN
jgi:hypothetical protein